MRNKKLIQDKDIVKIMENARKIINKDCLIIFRVKPRGCEFHSLHTDYRSVEVDEDEDLDSDLSLKYPKRIIEGDMEGSYPKVKGRDKDLSHDYIG